MLCRLLSIYHNTPDPSRLNKLGTMDMFIDGRLFLLSWFIRIADLVDNWYRYLESHVSFPLLYKNTLLMKVMYFGGGVNIKTQVYAWRFIPYLSLVAK